MRKVEESFLDAISSVGKKLKTLELLMELTQVICSEMLLKKEGYYIVTQHFWPAKFIHKCHFLHMKQVLNQTKHIVNQPLGTDKPRPATL